MTDANFLLVQFSKFSVGSVFPATSGSVQHLSVAMLKTFMHGDLSAVYPTSHLCVVLHFLILYNGCNQVDRRNPCCL